MTTMPSLPSPLRRGLRVRALLSWTCCLAALLLALTVCHQSGPRTGAGSVPSVSAAASAQPLPSSDGQGCAHHRSGNHCLTGLQHLPQSYVPLPDDTVLPPAAHSVSSAVPRAGPSSADTAPRPGVDLHALQVQRI